MNEMFSNAGNIEDCWFEIAGAFSNTGIIVESITCFIAPKIKKVIFNDPATIVCWIDGTKTVVKCQEGDTFDKEKGLAMAIIKKMSGNKGNYNNIFSKWIKDEK